MGQFVRATNRSLPFMLRETECKAQIATHPAQLVVWLDLRSSTADPHSRGSVGCILLLGLITSDQLRWALRVPPGSARFLVDCRLLMYPKR